MRRRVMRSPRHWMASTGLLAGLLCACLALPSHSQDNKAVSREREALRRAQAALQQSQQQRDALLTEKAELQRKQQAQADQLKASQASLATATAAQAELRRLKTAQQAQQAERLQERQRVEQAQADALAQAQAQADNQQRTLVQNHQQQLAVLRAEHNATVQTNRALVARLEAATQALADARERNRKLHALGREAVDRYLGVTPLQRALQAEPVLGLGAVRMHSQAEDLLQALDAQRLPDNTVAP